MPISLRRSIRYLYQSFSKALTDPCMFDVVLDLFDAFATLHALLNRAFARKGILGTEVPSRQAQRPWRGSHGTAVQPGRRDAGCARSSNDEILPRCLLLGHGPRIPRRPKSARSGSGRTNQVRPRYRRLYASPDGVLNSSIDRLGVLAKIGPIPDVSCHSLNFGTEDKARLAFFTIDVAQWPTSPATTTLSMKAATWCSMPWLKRRRRNRFSTRTTRTSASGFPRRFRRCWGRCWCSAPT